MLPRLTCVESCEDKGPFEIIKKVHYLVYHIDVPGFLGTDPIISVIHLEQAPENGATDRQIQVDYCEQGCSWFRNQLATTS